MKKLIFAFAGLFVALNARSQMTIAEARAQGIGQTVTIKGTVTNGSELGNIRYLQDETGALAAFGSTLSGVQRYDSITVTGVLFDFSGLLELSPVNSFVNHGDAVVVPTPLQLPITSAAEVHESKYIEIQNVTFVQTGMFANGNSTVQITNGTNTFDVRINGSTNIDNTAIPTGPVTIRGLHGQFNANYQIVPRDVNDIVPYVAPDKEINVLINGQNILNGANYFIGAASVLNVSIENLGVNPLSITGHTFSGSNTADFSSNINASSVTGGNANAYTITFAPAGLGSRFASISIGNNDSDENPFVINFEGVGTNDLATEPTSNPSNLTFPIIEAYKLSGQYSAGSGATKYIVLWKNGSAITGVPADGTTYLRGDVVGDARVAYVGSGTGFTPRGIIANQNYYFKVYAFNGQGGYENYLTTNPATGNVTSLGEYIGNYYQGISSASPTLVTDLRNLINPHTQLSYFSYKQTMMNEFEIKDTTNGQSYVTCAYSGERKIFNDPFDWTPTGYSREHTYSHSWMPTFPADSPEEPEYTDQHHLYPTNLEEANTPRSNLPMDEITGTTVFTYLEGSVGFNGTQLVYEPRASQKGNAARAIMYMAVCYNFPLSGDIDADKQNVQTLINWHFEDLPDNYEIARHEYVFSLQENRNPFIDSVDFACYINVDDNSYDAAGCSNSISENLDSKFVVFPVPSSDKIYLQVNGTVINAYIVTDMNGREIVRRSELAEDVLILNSADFANGAYMVQVVTPYGTVNKKMIVE
jgi:DNA/RNA endonuclease YhcR with UshA esterase domain